MKTTQTPAAYGAALALLTFVAVSLVVAPLRARSEALTLEEVLFPGNEAIIAYEQAFSGLIRDEQYTQPVVGFDGSIRRLESWHRNTWASGPPLRKNGSGFPTSSQWTESPGSIPILNWTPFAELPRSGNLSARAIPVVQGKRIPFNSRGGPGKNNRAPPGI